MIFVAISCAFVLCLSAVFYYLQFYFGKFLRQGIDGPAPSILFGNTKSSVLKKRHIAYDVDDIYKKFKGKSPVAGFFSAFTPYVLLMEPDLVKVCRKFRNNDFIVRNFN